LPSGLESLEFGVTYNHSLEGVNLPINLLRSLAGGFICFSLPLHEMMIPFEPQRVLV
jgi:hypothetical protein